MARDEKVIYRCDVCGKRAEAQRVSQDNDGRNSYYVRPDQWGHLFATAQRQDERIQRKVDFCSEECLTKVYEDWYSEAYDEDPA